MINLLADCLKTKKLLNELKTMSINSWNYELAAELREYEKKNFPDSPDLSQAKQYELALRILKVSVPDLRTAYILSELAKVTNLKEFSLKNSDDILENAKNI